MLLTGLLIYTLWATIGCVIAISTARLAHYTVYDDKDYSFLELLAIVSMGPFVHFWLRRRGY